MTKQEFRFKIVYMYINVLLCTIKT